MTTTTTETEIGLLLCESVSAWSHSDTERLTNVGGVASPGLPDGPVEAKCTRCRAVRTTLSRAYHVKLRCVECRMATDHVALDKDALLRACRYLEQLLMLICERVEYLDLKRDLVAVDVWVDEAGMDTRRHVRIKSGLPLTRRLYALRWAWVNFGKVFDERFSTGELCSFDVPFAYDRHSSGWFRLGVRRD